MREVNALLRHDQEVVARARTHASNPAHALKTPLSVLALEAERTGSAEAAAAVAQMDRMIRHHLRRARAAASHGVLGARAELAPVLDDLLAVLERIHVDRHVRVAVEADAGAAFAGERQDLEEMLGNLLDNAFKWAAGRIAVEVRLDGPAGETGGLRIAIGDDGPGLSGDDMARATRPGTRLDEAVPGTVSGSPSPPTGRPLWRPPVLDRAPAGGLRATLDLPAAAPSPFSN